MVTGEEHDSPGRGLGRERLLDLAEPRRQFFQPPQTARRFRERIEMVPDVFFTE